jgi:hypothetical protein
LPDRLPLLPQTRPFKTTVFAVRIGSLKPWVPGTPMRTLHPTRRSVPFRALRGSAWSDLSDAGPPLRCARSWYRPTGAPGSGSSGGVHAGPGGPGRVIGTHDEGTESCRRIGCADARPAQPPPAPPSGLKTSSMVCRGRRRAHPAEHLGDGPAHVLGSGVGSAGPPTAIGAHAPCATWVDSRRCRGHVDAGGQGRRSGQDRLPWEFCHQGPATGRVELGEHVIEEQDGGEVGPRNHELVHPDPQGQRQAALLALRGVRAGLPSVEGQHEIVPMWPHRVHAPPQVVRPVATSASSRLPRPAPDVLLADHDPVRNAGEAAVGRTHELFESGWSGAPGR